MLKATSRLITIGLPIFCLVIAIGLVIYEYHRYTSLQADLAMTQKQYEALTASLQDSKVHLDEDRVPTAFADREEDTKFLEGLKLNASETGVVIVKWISTNRPAGTNGAVTAENQPAYLKGVTAIVSDLEVFGPYDSVRSFVVRLEASHRLLNMDKVTWHRGQKEGTRLFMTLTRYVTASAKSSEGASGAASNGTGGSR